MTMSREERIALNDNIHYKHFKIEWLEGIAAYATVAYVRANEEGDVFYAFTFCAPDDQFERKEGRHRAKRRLFEALKNSLGGHSGQVSAPSDGPWPAKVFPPKLRIWLRGAIEQGMATSRWFYEIPSTDAKTLKIEPWERKK